MRPFLALPSVVASLLIVIVAIEAVLLAADLGWIGTMRWRSLAYQYGAFWPGLLADWRPNYTGQPVTMFATYAFLHAGLGHLAGNAVTLLALGPMVCARAGQRGFAAIYAGSALLGALFFTGLSAGTQPMIGASGALFGLAGALTGWMWLDRTSDRSGATRAFAFAFGLVMLNVALWWWEDGRLAWETHLGGYIGGVLLAGWVGSRDTA